MKVFCFFCLIKWASSHSNLQARSNSSPYHQAFIGQCQGDSRSVVRLIWMSKCEFVPTCIGASNYRSLPGQPHRAGSRIPAASALQTHHVRQQRGGKNPKWVTQDIKPSHFTCPTVTALDCRMREGRARSNPLKFKLVLCGWVCSQVLLSSDAPSYRGARASR